MSKLALHSGVLLSVPKLAFYKHDIAFGAKVGTPQQGISIGDKVNLLQQGTAYGAKVGTPQRGISIGAKVNLLQQGIAYGAKVSFLQARHCLRWQS